MAAGHRTGDRGRRCKTLGPRPYTPLRFVKKSLYHLVRHRLLLGFIIAFCATPEMSQGHLLFTAVTTLWMVISIRWEETDLARHHGDDYRQYQKQVSMLIPVPKGTR